MKKLLFSLALVAVMSSALAQSIYTEPSQLIGHTVRIAHHVDPAQAFSNKVFILHHKKMTRVAQFSTTPGYEFQVENPFIHRNQTYVCLRNPNQRFWVRYDELDSLLPYLDPCEEWEAWINQLRHTAHYYDAQASRRIFFCPDSLLISHRYLPIEWLSYALGPDGTPAYAIVRTGTSTLQAVSFSHISRAQRSSHFLSSPEPRRTSATTTPPPMSGFVSATNDLQTPSPTHIADSAQFPGGTEALIQHIITQIHYPLQAIEQNISGTVEVSFIIETDGTISSAIIPHDIGGGCGQEALRIIMSLPHFNTAPKRILCSMPIRFNLR